MATLRDVKSRISTVQNIKKITETMEKISTAKIKKNTNRLTSISDYKTNLDLMINDIVLFAREESEELESPLLRVSRECKRSLLVVLTSNRGLCGGYNQNIINLSIKTYDRLSSEGKELTNYVIGKKAVSALKYREIPISQSFIDIDDNVSYERMSSLANEIISFYEEAKVDEVYLIYTKFYNNARQSPVLEKILPFEFKKVDEASPAGYRDNYLSEPSLGGVIDNILPLGIRIKLFYMVLEGVLSEQIARRIAMKQASDSAGDIIKDLTLQYNRARQSKITKEIIEIVGAAKALKK